MSIVKIFGIIVLVAVFVIVAGAVMLSVKSKSGAALGLVDGVLAPCPSTPNCVSSEAGTPPSHIINSLGAANWDKIPALIEQSGGKITTQNETYIAAEFTTPLMRFVDDVEFRKAESAVHVRSASRVGKSDLGANAKRVEQFRAALQQ